MRRAVVIFKKHGVKDLTRNQLVSMVYQLLSEGDEVLAKQLHSPQKFKPFTFAADELDGNLTLYFSSPKENITNTFVTGVEKNKDNGLLIGNSVYKIIDVVKLTDMRYLENKVRLRAISPITVSRCENGKKRYISYKKETGAWLEAIEKNLLKRIKKYLDKDANLQLRVINEGKYTIVDYQGGKIPARQQISIEIKGNPEVLDIAVYGGIGERTGSGFGMVLPF